MALARRDRALWARLAVGLALSWAPSRAAAQAGEAAPVATVAETTPEGLRLSVTAPPVPADERAAREAALRLTTLDAIHRAGLQP